MVRAELTRLWPRGVRVRMAAALIGALIGLPNEIGQIPAAHARTPLDHRPANFFILLSQKDKSICQPVLKSLNKEYRPTAPLNYAVNDNLITDMLLTSEFQIQWVRPPIREPDEPKGQTVTVDYAPVDLANNGHPVAVYRWDFVDRTGYQNKLFVLPDPMPDVVTPGVVAPFDAIGKLLGPNAENELKINEATAHLPDYPLNGFFDFNILEVSGRVYLLGAGSMAAQDSAGFLPVLTSDTSFGTFVMEYHSKEEITLVCHFRGGASTKR